MFVIQYKDSDKAANKVLRYQQTYIVRILVI